MQSMNNTPHRICSALNGLDMIGFTDGEFFRCGSASGPLAPSFTDEGEIQRGDKLTLPYNYATDEYALRSGGWECIVVRINRKSVTVTDMSANVQTFRIEL